MRPLLLALLLAVLLVVIAPQWLRHYFLSQLKYLVTFGWLKEISLLLRPWVWIPAQCTLFGWTFQWGFINLFCGLVCFCSHKRWHDNTWRFVALQTFIHCAIYSRHVLTDYVFCSPKGEMEGGCKSIVADGVNSVSIFMWWVDGLLIHPLSLIVVIVEGWRVRMPLFKTVVYAILANGYTQIVALPLFFIEWRNYVRINDCIWNLDMEDPKSPVRIEAEKDRLKSLSNLTPRRKNKPTAPLAPLSLSRAPTINVNTGHDSASEIQVHGREAASPSTLRNRLAGRSMQVHAAPLSPVAVNTPRRSSRRSRGGAAAVRESSPAAESKVAAAHHDAAVEPDSANSDDLPMVADTPVMGGRFLTPSLMRRLSSDAQEFLTRTSSSSASSTSVSRPLSARERDHSPEPEEAPSAAIDMQSVTERWWAAGGVTKEKLAANPSPINVRAYPTIMKDTFPRFNVPLSTMLPMLFIFLGTMELWTWLTWMDAYCRNNCWLGGFFDYAFESASSLMMTTGGWHGLWIWGIFMNSVEPSPYRKWTFYPFLMLTFHNVATGMCYYLVWREFRMRYLPRGADRSVWETSHNPDAYFVPQTSSQVQKHFRHQLRHKIWKGIIVPMFQRLAAPFCWACTFPPAAKMLAKAWGLICAYPWLHNFVVDMWRLGVTSIKENWSDIQEVLSAWVRAAMRLLACSPLPTPSSRQALVDWTLLVPYSLLVWALNLNAFVICWYFDLNSAARAMFAFTNGFVTLTLIHIRKHNLTRIIFVWLNYEPIAEAIERAASPLAHTLQVDEAEASQTFHAGTGINLMPTQSIKEKLRTQIEELTERGENEVFWYRRFYWNLHIVWTLTLVFLYSIATVTLIARAEFALPWWTSIYEAFRTQAFDAIHRDPFSSTLNIPLGGLSLLMAYPLFFGFGWPRLDRGLPNTSPILKVLIILPLLVTFGAVWNEETQPCYLPLGQEGPAPTEHEFFQMGQLIETLVQKRAKPVHPMGAPQFVARPVHPKTHGCVEATFTTPYTVPSKFRAGLFNKGDPLNGNSTWKAFVRFSNGALQRRGADGVWSSQADSVADVRGMAVKLLQVHGPKALNESELAAFPESLTHDFLTISSDFFFQSNASTYASFIAAVADPDEGLANWLMPKAVADWFNLDQLRAFGARIRTLWKAWLMNRDGAGVINPLDINYYSAVPYQLGPNGTESSLAGHATMAVKYRWRPCHTHHAPKRTSTQRAAAKAAHLWHQAQRAWGRLTGLALSNKRYESMTLREHEAFTAQRNPHNFLRINLQNRLNPSAGPDAAAVEHEAGERNGGDEICFDLMLQDQINACQNKIEDAETPWVQEWIRVGRLTIPRQTFLSAKQLEFCENLSFNPWHALEAHRPIGAINAMRKYAYLTAADSRRRSNGANSSATRRADFFGNELTLLGRLDGNIAGDAARYDYASYPSPYQFLPRHIAVLPDNETMSNVTRTDIMSRFLFSERSIAYAQARLGLEWKSAQDYEHFMLGRKGEQLVNNTNHLVSGRMRRPAHVEHNVWTSDRWWASQFTRGLNPMMIQRVHTAAPKHRRVQLPKALATVDAEMARGVAAELSANKDRASSIEQLAGEGRLFVVDYEELDDIQTWGERVLMSPIVLFYLNSNTRALMPLLIQLDRPQHLAPGTRPFIYFPRPMSAGMVDATNEQLVWLFAKMHVSSADASMHQMVFHLCETHLALEPTVSDQHKRGIIATHRAFSASHPVLRLLRQHFTGTIAINDFGRVTLLSDMTAQLDQFLAPGLQGSLQLMQKHFNRSFVFMETVPEQLSRRGFDVERPRDPSHWGDAQDELPGFLYRDYGLLLWRTMRQYVLDVLSSDAFYGATAAVQARRLAADPQVRAWHLELSSPSAANIHNVRRVDSFPQLVDLVTQVMFQGSAQHAAVNFGQFEFQAFQPSRPLLLRRGMPANRTLVTNAYILKSLMKLDDVLVTNSLFDTLSACCINTLMLDDSEADGLLDARTTITPAFPDEYERFKVQLRAVEAEMKAHNRKAGIDYPYLFPSRIPMSTAI